MKDPQIEPRMYREQKETLGEKKQSNGFTIKQKTKTIAYGVDTNTTSRKQMFDMLPELVETEYDKFISPNIYKDISTLERKKTGKIEHSDTGHDDSLMAYLIFRYAVFYGKCFRDKFGINPVPSRLNIKVQSMTSDMTKIASLIEGANSGRIVENMSNGSDVYSLLQKQQKNLEDSDKKMESIMRIINLNK